MKLPAHRTGPASLKTQDQVPAPATYFRDASAIVTGAGSGIGRELALALAAEDAAEETARVGVGTMVPYRADVAQRV